MEESRDARSLEEGKGGLEARVVRLEEEVALLRSQLAGRSAAAAETRTAQRVLRETPAPPPPLPSTVTVEVPAAALPGTNVAPKFRTAGSSGSLENRLGSQWFNRIGLVLLLIGTSWALKYAVDQGWIVPSPTARVIFGLLAGAGIVVWSERFRRKGFPAFSYSMKALGSGVLYLSLWAGFRIYDLMPASVALGLMVAVTAWNAFMAWAQDSELLAAYALAGGFATPLLLATGGNHETFLFAYLLAIDIAMVALVRLKTWPRLLLGALPLTVAFFIGWYVQYYAAEALGLTSIFIVLYGLVFGSVPLGGGLKEADAASSVRRRSVLIEEILAPLATAAFVALAFYSVLQDSGHHAWLPWMVVVLAAVYLGVMRLPQARTAAAIHLSIAVVLLTIAIPLKASGHWITAGWLVEGLALVWVAARLASVHASNAGEAFASGVLRWLGFAALGLGFCGVVVHEMSSLQSANAMLWSSDTGTAVLGIGVFAAVAWLVNSQLREVHDWLAILISGVVAVDAVALMLTLHELAGSWSGGVSHPPFRSGDFVTALLGLAVLAAVIAIAVRARRGEVNKAFWDVCGAASIVAFNVMAVVTGVREVTSIWEAGAVDVDAALKQALAVSGFLMLYGACLLAVGFWRRSAFLRWQALALLVFTIFKAFLYDMRSLSQGYRAVSFLALGALLMAISFAYQKDWLSLRPTHAEPSGDHTEATE